MKRALTLTAAMTLALAVPGSAALAGHGGSNYGATLNELNNSGASGSAEIQLNNDATQATVTIFMAGLADGLPHAQHIHGELSSANTCPTPDADANGDGVIDVAEGLPSYGGVQLSLTTSGDTSADSALAVDRFPVGNEGYTRTFDIPEDISNSLADLHVVIHGVDENGDGEYNGDTPSSLDPSLPREATLPAACGQLALVSAGQGGVQTGGGGTGTSPATSGLVIAGLAGTALAAGAGLRRRRAEG